MKPVALILVFLAISQARVLNLPNEPIDVPVAIVQDKQPPAALSLVNEELKEQAKPEEVKPISLEEKARHIDGEDKPEIKSKTEEIKELEPVVESVTKQKELNRPEIKKGSLEIEEKPQEVKQPEIKQETTEIKGEPAQNILKSLPAEEAAIVPAVELSPNPEDQVQSVDQDAAHPQVRQATQATPTQQSTTQGNFVQQLIQNSPIGQFLNQFQPQPAAAAAAAAAPAQAQADEAAPAAAAPATPAPTVPGFLNPQAAITSAQQAVQNAAQTAVNATTQAFQGIQQFASNLGNQFQNTLSSLTGQQQQAVSTTPRPPGPIQQFVNNVFGGNNNATAAAPPAQQGGNPLQGIINFLGGNRPQNAPAAAPATQAPEKPAVDDKIDPAQDEFAPESENELRASGESIDDSFEDAAVPSNEVIVVNDDAGEDGNAVHNHPVATDAVAL
ncbi:20-hydroxyecdysone protein [Drosophila erecta]|uniref:20-hydroxyecdysone protein n=1 Tax=Drosophila erecta TaxID=7220 RepID=B3NBX6_DROER|nr:20-hydroxyecdysone protein [Drosophila erecta]EDV50793.1 uncharacterized protein Dere_GG14254 [Drosophila erecta]